MDEFIVWVLVIIVGCTAIWAVSVWRSKKRASQGGCILCGKDLGHKPDASAVQDVLVGDSQYTLSSTWRTAEYIKQVRKVMCLHCSRKVVRQLYARCVGGIVVAVLVSAGLAVNVVVEAKAGRFDPAMLGGLVPALGLSACIIYFIHRRVQYVRSVLENISQEMQAEGKA